MADDPPTPSAQPPKARPNVSPMVRWKQAHASLAPFVLAPLILTASTGIAYRVVKDWMGWPRDRAHPLMTLHEGEWLKPLFGPHGETLYVVLNGLGLLWMLTTGALMLSQRLLRWWDSRQKRRNEGGEGT
ncbi:MAG: peptidase [Cyanobacteriota bacterium]|nr:peptidase [Cyanobacteriota bacterium]